MILKMTKNGTTNPVYSECVISSASFLENYFTVFDVNS